MPVILLYLVVIVVGFAPYLINGYKLAGCDFESDYKCEVIHSIGVVVPPSSLITVWFDDDR